MFTPVLAKHSIEVVCAPPVQKSASRKFAGTDWEILPSHSKRDVIPWNEKPTHHPKNSSPRNLSARHFLTFISADHVDRATQNQLGVESADIRGLPLLASELPFKLPELDGQGVIQWEESKDGIFEHNLVARRPPARPNHESGRYVGDLYPANPDGELRQV